MALKQTAAKTTTIEVPALQLQETPPVFVVVIPGRWLLQHTTPSWRHNDPMLGFQRIVKEDRAKQIARTILDRERAFPNAITLATDTRQFAFSNGKIAVPNRTKFLVVDGQHRLWAQKFSVKDGQYACIIHLNKSEKEMAELFLEINENQRRVPSSLRWDLVRLVRPEGDEAGITASEIVFALVERDDSPFHIAMSSAEDVKEQDAEEKKLRKKQGAQASIDLTGEQKELSIKQGSLAPEIKTLVGRLKKRHNPTFDDYVSLLIRFFSAVRSLNPGGWGDPTSTYYRARVLRALIRVLTEMALEASSLDKLTALVMLAKLKKVDPATLSEERIRSAQGSAGVIDLFDAMKKQVFA